jgi:hypothetical protein
LSLERVKGLKQAEVSRERDLATATYDDIQTNEQQLREALNATGFKAEPSCSSKASQSGPANSNDLRLASAQNCAMRKPSVR